jgi:hypothetical protein
MSRLWWSAFMNNSLTLYTEYFLHVKNYKHGDNYNSVVMSSKSDACMIYAQLVI